METKKLRLYQLVGNYMKDQHEYLTTRQIAATLNLQKMQVVCAMYDVKKHLASQGVILVNKPSQGYKVGTLSELSKETDKACKRALSTLAAQLDVINRLHASGAYDKEELAGLWQLLKENLETLQVIFDDSEIEPRIPEFVTEISRELIE